MLSEKRGRPTKYKPEFCEKIIDFFSGDPYERYKDKDGNPTGLPPKLPTIERFSDSIGVSKRTLYDWGKKHVDFLHAIEKAQQKEKLFLMDAALAGIYDRQYSIFIRNGMTDGMPNIHRCRTIRNKQIKIQESTVSGAITVDQAIKLTELVKAEAYITDLSLMKECAELRS